MEIQYNEDIMALIARNLAGLTDSIEDARLNEWVNCSAENKQYFEQVKNVWDLSDKPIDPKRIDTRAALEKLLGRIPELTPKMTLWSYWQKVAAILILPLAIGFLVWIYLNSQKINSADEIVYNEVYAAFGTRSSLKLADSTIVWLNSGSYLRYPGKLNGKNRKVYLKGEAYFEVKSDKSRQFIVETPNLQVIATGTKFNIQAYDFTPVTEVTLASGKIFVKESSEKVNSKIITELYTDQHFEYDNQTKANSIINTDSYRYIAWKDGTLVFRNEPLEKVLNKLSVLFNVDIELQGKEIRNYRYRATFQDESFEEILKLLKLSSPINYREVKRDPLPDGSFPRKKVIISPVRANSK